MPSHSSLSSHPASLWEVDSKAATEVTDITCAEPELDFYPIHPTHTPLFRKLIGTWSLEKASASTASGDWIDTPLGSAPKGMLIYSHDGYVTYSVEPADDAPASAPPVALYTGPFELSDPSTSPGDYGDLKPDAICYDMLDSSICAQDIGLILEREIKMLGHGPRRKLCMRLNDAWPLGTHVSLFP